MPNLISLSGTWRALPENDAPKNFWMPDIDDSDWYKIHVPSHWQRAKKELASFHGTLVYRTHFGFSPEKNSRYWLRFDGVTQFAKVWLNGKFLGEHEGYFEPFEYEITDILREKNVITVAVRCPWQKERNNKDTALGVYGHWDASDPFAVIGGIWRDVYLVNTGATHIRYINVETRVAKDLDALIKITGNVDTTKESKVIVRIPSLGYSRKILVMPETGKFTLSLKARQPPLWWPWEHGEPTLHELHVETNGDEYLVKFGIREVRAKKHWEFFINWRRMFLRGTNYISEMWPAEADVKRFRDDIKLMKNANMNIARVHAHVEPREFYDVADEEGFLLWQDNSLQWTYIPSSWPRLVDQTKRMIRLLKNHPSVVIYCLHNEPSMRESYGSLDRMLIKAAQSEDPTRPILPYSGELSPIQLLLNMALARLSSWPSIDLHWYGGWYAFKTYTDLRWLILMMWPLLKIKAEFISEFGAQSLPCRENFERIPEYGRISKKDLNDWKKLTIHRLQPDRWKVVFDINDQIRPIDMIERSQKYQAKLTKYYIELFRSRKYDNVNAVLQFMFVDCWPAITWSIVDYWRKPKLAYYYTKVAFEPVLAFIDWPRETRKPGTTEQYTLHVINDTWQPVTVDVEVMLLDEQEKVRMYRKFNFSLRADSIIHPAMIKWTIPKDAHGTWTLRVITRTSEKEVENDYELSIRQ